MHTRESLQAQQRRAKRGCPLNTINQGGGTNRLYYLAKGIFGKLPFRSDKQLLGLKFRVFPQLLCPLEISESEYITLFLHDLNYVNASQYFIAF